MGGGNGASVASRLARKPRPIQLFRERLPERKKHGTIPKGNPFNRTEAV